MYEKSACLNPPPQKKPKKQKNNNKEPSAISLTRETNSN